MFYDIIIFNIKNDNNNNAILCAFFIGSHVKIWSVFLGLESSNRNARLLYLHVLVETTFLQLTLLTVTEGKPREVQLATTNLLVYSIDILNLSSSLS